MAVPSCPTYTAPVSAQNIGIAMGLEDIYGSRSVRMSGFPAFNELNPITAVGRAGSATPRSRYQTMIASPQGTWWDIRFATYADGTGTIKEIPKWAEALECAGYVVVDGDQYEPFIRRRFDPYARSASVEVFYGQKYHLATGAHASFSMEGTANQPVRFLFTMNGLFHQPSIRQDTYVHPATSMPPLLRGAQLQFSFPRGRTITPVCQSFSFDPGIKVQTRNGRSKTGHPTAFFLSPSLDARWHFVVEMNYIEEWLDLWHQKSECNISMTIGQEAGKKLVMRTSKENAYLKSIPTEGNAGKIRIVDLAFGISSNDGIEFLHA